MKKMLDPKQLLATCKLGAQAGAAELMAWRGRFSSQQKSAHDLVTDADFASQQAIQAIIRERHPDHGFLGEEKPDREQLKLPYFWVVDPLDGTTNYVHDFPCFAVSVAVAYQGQLVAGAVLDPLREECFLAAAGEGSWLNGEPIRVSRTKALGEALVAVSFPPDLQIDSPDLQAFLEVAPRCQAVRRTGSAALNLAYVACGRLDAHWAHFIHPWDSAAGVLLVREAGGVATAMRGGEYELSAGDYFVASQTELYQELLPLVVPAFRNMK
ncbi:MAG: inositol monophosphatase [Pirellulales bacterium]|nr:inositol monophosphatase [Pirellulales bacterium]